MDEVQGYAALELLDAARGQLSLPLDWGREPWQGYRPRYLCNVDKCRTFAEPATETPFITDPAQLQIWVASKPPNPSTKEVRNGT